MASQSSIATRRQLAMSTIDKYLDRLADKFCIELPVDINARFARKDNPELNVVYTLERIARFLEQLDGVSPPTDDEPTKPRRKAA